MNELEIAEKKVLPHIKKVFKWPERLISEYGRVPVQTGTKVVWADFVFYININNAPFPWLLVEVKKPNGPIREAVPQAESYSLLLNSPFFLVTDGNKYQYYKTGDSQGTSIAIKKNSLPIPNAEYLKTDLKYVIFPPIVDTLIDLFINGLKNEPKFLADTKEHHERKKQLNKKIFQRIDKITSKDFKELIDKKIIKLKTPNRNEIFKQIDKDFSKILKYLKFIRDFKGNPVENINKLINKEGDLYIKSGGIYFITQLLSGAHPKDYMVLEENISKSLKELGIINVLVKNDTANGYIYVNEICKRLYNDKLKDKLNEKYNFGLAAVHNFLWHYYRHYKDKKKWYP